MKKNRPILSILLFILLIIIQFGAFTPYTETITYISSQNVPHTTVVGRGWDNVSDIGYTHQNINNTIDREQINYALLIVQILLTMCVSTLICFGSKIKKLFTRKKQTNEIHILQAQNTQLQNTIDSLCAENKQLIADKEELKSLLFERNRQNRIQDFQTLPEIDINALAFADTETQEEAKRKYAIDMYRYVENLSSPNPNTFDEASAATEELFASEQLSLADIPPMLDISGLAFADEETSQNIQTKYAEDLSSLHHLSSPYLLYHKTKKKPRLFWTFSTV